MLIRLIYVSAATVELSSDELVALLEDASRRNAESGISGALLYAAGSFMQILEGDAADVDRVFERLQRDPRHHNVIVLEREPISARSFARWSMAFRHLGSDDLREHPAYSRYFQQGFDAAALGAVPGSAAELVCAFAKRFRD